MYTVPFGSLDGQYALYYMPTRWNNHTVLSVLSYPHPASGIGCRNAASVRFDIMRPTTQNTNQSRPT